MVIVEYGNNKTKKLCNDIKQAKKFLEKLLPKSYLLH